MSEVKNVMSSKRIAGAPVMEGDRILGMVSLSDVMNAMENGRMDTLVTDNMTKEVKTVLKDASVTEAIHNLDRQGFGRLPVVDRDGKLVGIVTTGTIMKALLHEMDVSFQRKEAEKLQTYRASHIFEDISSDDTSLILRYVVDDKDFANGEGFQHDKKVSSAPRSPAFHNQARGCGCVRGRDEFGDTHGCGWRNYSRYPPGSPHGLCGGPRAGNRRPRTSAPTGVFHRSGMDTRHGIRRRNGSGKHQEVLGHNVASI